MLYLLRKLPYIFDTFDPNPELMKQLNFERLIKNDPEHDCHIFDLMVFINRYYAGVGVKDYNLREDIEEKFRKEEMMRVWQAFDFVAKKVEKTQKRLKYRGVSSNSIIEIFVRI